MRTLHTLAAAALVVWPDRFAFLAALLVLLFLATLPARRTAVESEPSLLDPRALVHPLIGGVIVCIDLVAQGSAAGFGYWLAGPLVWLAWRRAAAGLGAGLGRVLDDALVLAGWTCLAVNGGYVAAILAGHGESFAFAGISGYFGFDERGFFAYSTSLLPHVGYLVPYFAWRLAHGAAPAPRSRWALLAGLIVVGALSLRLAILLAIAASLLVLAWRRWGARRLALAIALLGVVATAGALAVAASPELSAIAGGIYDLKIADKVAGDDLRFNQIAFWWHSFLESPLVGHGHSSSTIELNDMQTGDRLFLQLGTVDNPYGNEVLFARMLSEIGLLLVPVVAAYGAMMLRRVPRGARGAAQVGALRFAALMMVLQSQTNSYLNTSGWLFAFYFCIALIDTQRTPPGRLAGAHAPRLRPAVLPG